jgi:hypothetical protein
MSADAVVSLATPLPETESRTGGREEDHMLAPSVWRGPMRAIIRPARAEELQAAEELVARILRRQ